MRRALPLLAVLAAAGCGTPSADLFIIQRTGTLPGAKITMVVDDGGEVSCDGTKREMTSKQLLDARDIARDIAPLLKSHLDLPPGNLSLLRFKVTGEDGALRFSDSSPGRPPVLSRLLLLSRELAMQSCGRPR